jgi:Holliday junction resolvase RusA-like endonuclease
MSIKFTVIGCPQPQGSTKAFIPKGWNRAIITTANSKNKPWRQEVAGMAASYMEERSLDLLEELPIQVNVEFFFEKPKSTKKTVMHKITKPDIDKLARSVLDALTGVVFKDDSQVVRCTLGKSFGSPARAEIEVTQVSGLQPTMFS